MLFTNPWSLATARPTPQTEQPRVAAPEFQPLYGQSFRDTPVFSRSQPVAGASPRKARAAEAAAPLLGRRSLSEQNENTERNPEMSGGDLYRGQRMALATNLPAASRLRTPRRPPPRSLQPPRGPALGPSCSGDTEGDPRHVPTARTEAPPGRPGRRPQHPANPPQEGAPGLRARGGASAAPRSRGAWPAPVTAPPALDAVTGAAGPLRTGWGPDTPVSGLVKPEILACVSTAECAL